MDQRRLFALKYGFHPDIVPTQAFFVIKCSSLLNTPGIMVEIRMGSLLTSLVYSITPGWSRREATLTNHSEGRPAARARGTEQADSYDKITKQSPIRQGRSVSTDPLAEIVQTGGTDDEKTSVAYHGCGYGKPVRGT